MKKETFPHPGKAPHQRGDQPGQRGCFGDSEESAATSLQKAKRTETCTDGWYHHPTFPSLRCSSAGTDRGWMLKLWLWRSDPGRGPRVGCRKTA